MKNLGYIDFNGELKQIVDVIVSPSVLTSVIPSSISAFTIQSAWENHLLDFLKEAHLSHHKHVLICAFTLGQLEKIIIEYEIEASELSSAYVKLVAISVGTSQNKESSYCMI